MNRAKDMQMPLLNLACLGMCALLFGISCTPYAMATCLAYEPELVVVGGKLERKIFPGPPNYASIADGDKAETGFYLVLDEPVCMQGEEDADVYAQQSLKLIQLVLDAPAYKLLTPYLGQFVRLQGTLFARHTGHHHAPLVLRFKEIANKP